MGELTAIYQSLGTDTVYLFLIVGFWLGVTSVYVPGTGLLEVGALASLVAAGLGLLVTPVALPGLMLILVSLGCFLALIYYRRSKSLAMFGFFFHLLGSIFLFQLGSRPGVATIVIANAAALVYHQLLLVPGLRIQDRVSPVDPDTLIGQSGLVEETIDPVGTVRLGGIKWQATADDMIEKGSRVRVVRRDGLHLHVVLVDAPLDDQPWLRDHGPESVEVYAERR